MTNKEKYFGSEDRLVEFLASYCDEINPWSDWFDKTYCQKCETLYLDGKLIGLTGNRFVKCAYCEVNNKCKFFEYLPTIPTEEHIIKMWLSQPAD